MIKRILFVIGMVWAFVMPAPVNLQPFVINYSGTTVNVGAGWLKWADGTISSYPAASVQAIYPTSYIVLNYGTGKLHCLKRAIGDGEQLLGIATVSGGIITAYSYPDDYVVKESAVNRWKAKMLANKATQILGIGDSTTAGVPNNYVMWHQFLFNPTYASSNYNVLNAASTTFQNLGIGGTTSEFGLGYVGNAYVNVPNAVLGWGAYAQAVDNQGALASANTFSSYSTANLVKAGPSGLWNYAPDVVTMGWGVNGGTYNYPCLEGIARNVLEDHPGVDLIYITQNDGTNATVDWSPIGLYERQLADNIGGAVADTWAYMDEQRVLGNTVWQDSIHPNQLGETAWAEAVLGVCNAHAQFSRAIVPSSTRVIPCATSSETTSFGWSGDFVGGVPATSSGATALTGNSFNGSPYLPYNFGYTNNGAGGYSVANGGYIQYGHHMWNWACLVIQRGYGATNTFTANVGWVDTSGNANTINTISYTDSATTGPGNLEACTITETTAASSYLYSNGYTYNTPPWFSGGLRITITSGNANILGVIFGGPRHKPIPLKPNFRSFDLVGTFGDDTGDPVGFYPDLFYSDTLNNAFSFYLTKIKGIQIGLRRSSSGGQLRFYGDGSLLLDKDFYVASGRAPFLLTWLPANFSDYENALANHIFTVHYYGNNASKAAAATGYHALNIFSADVIY